MGTTDRPPLSILAAFLHGATTPSVLAVGGAAAVLLAWWLAALTLITPRLVGALPPELLLNNAGDDYAALTQEVFLQQRRAWEGPTVVLVGPSALREAISSPSSLAGKLTDLTGSPVTVVDLHADDLNIWETGAVAEALPRGLEGVLVLTVSPSKLGQPLVALEKRATRPRLGWSSPLVEAEMVRARIDPPLRTGIYAVDNRGFLFARARRLPQRLWDPPELKIRRHRWKRAANQQRLVRINAKNQRAKTKSYPTRGAANHEVLGRIVDTFQARSSARIVLLEAPARADLREVIGPAIWDAYRRDIQAFAKSRTGVRYLNLNHQLEHDDFVDYLHVHDKKAEKRYTAALAKALAPGAVP